MNNLDKKLIYCMGSFCSLNEWPFWVLLCKDDGVISASPHSVGFSFYQFFNMVFHFTFCLGDKGKKTPIFFCFCFSPFSSVACYNFEKV